MWFGRSAVAGNQERENGCLPHRAKAQRDSVVDTRHAGYFIWEDAADPYATLVSAWWEKLRDSFAHQPAGTIGVRGGIGLVDHDGADQMNAFCRRDSVSTHRASPARQPFRLSVERCQSLRYCSKYASISPSIVRMFAGF